MPSSELPSHLAVHNFIAECGRPENAVLHAHVTELIALTHTPGLNNDKTINKILLGMHTELVIFQPDGVGFVPYSLPGTPEIASKTVSAFKGHDVVIWEKHGCFAVGNDIDDAFDKVDLFAKAASIFLTCKSVGFEPSGLSENILKEIRDEYNPHRNR